MKDFNSTPMTDEHEIHEISSDLIEEVSGGILPFWVAMVFIASTGTSFSIADRMMN